MSNKESELKLSWDKKISMREIAQFYEDKIRELDGKTQRLTEQTKMLSEQSEKMMDEMRAKVDKTLDERAGQRISSINKQIVSFEAKIEDLNQRAKIALDFLSKYDDIKTLIESERKLSFDSLQSTLEAMGKEAQSLYREETEKVIEAQREGNMKRLIRTQLEIDIIVSDFYRFMYEHDRNYFEMQYSLFKIVKTRPEVFLSMAHVYMKGDPNVTNKIALPIINSMVDDYIKMFSMIINDNVKIQKTKDSTTGSD